jgi:hypothetical protein
LIPTPSIFYPAVFIKFSTGKSSPHLWRGETLFPFFPMLFRI